MECISGILGIVGLLLGTISFIPKCAATIPPCLMSWGCPTIRSMMGIITTAGGCGLDGLRAILSAVMSGGVCAGVTGLGIPNVLGLIYNLGDHVLIAIGKIVGIPGK